MENIRANALSQRKDYLGKSIERLKAILKVKANELKYNYEFLVIFIIIENNNLIKLIKYIYQINKCATKVLQSLTRDFVKNKANILCFKRFVYIPSKLKQHFVKEQHLLPAYKHQGIARIFERITKDYYFLKIKKHIKKVIGKCNLCARSKANKYAPYGLLQSLPITDKA